MRSSRSARWTRPRASRAALLLLDEHRDVGERPGALGRAGGVVLAIVDAGVAQVLVAAGEAGVRAPRPACARDRRRSAARPGGCRPWRRAARRRRRAAGCSRRAAGRSTRPRAPDAHIPVSTGFRPSKPARRSRSYADVHAGNKENPPCLPRTGRPDPRSSLPERPAGRQASCFDNVRSPAPGGGRGSSGTRGPGSRRPACRRRRCSRGARSGRGGGPRPRCR